MPPGVFVHDLTYFRKLPLTANYKAHNVALKWFREVCEREGASEKRFSNTVQEQVAHIAHAKGTEFAFDENVFTTWKWQEMVAQLDDHSMRVVVNGPNNLSRGLVGCSIQQSGSYDHKRHHAKKQLGIPTPAMLFVWDFVLGRDDGTCVALHPNYSNTKLSCKLTPRPAVADTSLPRTGLGGTSGPRTFRRFAGKQVDVTLRFDASKPVTRP